MKPRDRHERPEARFELPEAAPSRYARLRPAGESPAKPTPSRAARSAAFMADPRPRSLPLPACGYCWPRIPPLPVSFQSLWPKRAKDRDVETQHSSVAIRELLNRAGIVVNRAPHDTAPDNNGQVLWDEFIQIHRRRAEPE